MHTNLYSDVFNYNNADIKSFILSRLTSSLKVKLNIFLLAFEFEHCIEVGGGGVINGHLKIFIRNHAENVQYRILISTIYNLGIYSNF